jgi:hypothetical protein
LNIRVKRAAQAARQLNSAASNVDEPPLDFDQHAELYTGAAEPTDQRFGTSMTTTKTQTFWDSFRRFEGLNSDAYAVTYFRTSPAVADDLLSMIVEGAKRATAGPMHYFGEGREESLPIVGDYTILLDRRSHPRLIWRTTQLSIAP